jgi:hypothetical protein
MGSLSLDAMKINESKSFAEERKSENEDETSTSIF